MRTYALPQIVVSAFFALVIFDSAHGANAEPASGATTIPLPTTADWYVHRSNANIDAPSVGADGSVSFSKMDYNSHAWSYFSPVALETNQWISVSGKISFSGIETVKSGKFLFGLFDSGANTQTVLNQTLANAGFGHGINSSGKSTTLGMPIITGSMSGFFTGTESSAYVRTGTSAGFLSTGNGATALTLDNAGVSLAAGVAYEFSLKVTKTGETAYTLEVFTKGGDGSESTGRATFSGASAVSQFDVFGFKSPVPAGGSATLSDLSFLTTGTLVGALSDLPEPSHFGVFAGLFALALVSTRRRRRR